MVAEKDWDKTVGTAEDVRRIFEKVPAMLIGLEGPEHRFIAVNAAYRASIQASARWECWRARSIPSWRASRFSRCSTGCIRPANRNPGRSGGCRPTSTGPEVEERYFDFLVTPRRRADRSIEGVQIIFDDVTSAYRRDWPPRRASRSCPSGTATSAIRPSSCSRRCWPHLCPSFPAPTSPREYLVAAEDTAAGGDWFDAIALGDRLVLVVGDVVGHGVEAAAVMSQLRTALRMQISRAHHRRSTRGSRPLP